MKLTVMRELMGENARRRGALATLDRGFDPSSGSAQRDVLSLDRSKSGSPAQSFSERIKNPKCRAQLGSIFRESMAQRQRSTPVNFSDDRWTTTDFYAEMREEHSSFNVASESRSFRKMHVIAESPQNYKIQADGDDFVVARQLLREVPPPSERWQSVNLVGEVIDDRQPETDEELNLYAGTVVLIKAQACRWFKGFFRGRLGAFPCSAVRQLVLDDLKGCHALVLYEYRPNNDDELWIKKHEVVEIVDTNATDPGWWKGTVKNRTGLFPDNHVEIVDLARSLAHSGSLGDLPTPPTRTLPSLPLCEQNYRQADELSSCDTGSNGGCQPDAGVVQPLSTDGRTSASSRSATAISPPASMHEGRVVCSNQQRAAEPLSISGMGCCPEACQSTYVPNGRQGYCYRRRLLIDETDCLHRYFHEIEAELANTKNMMAKMSEYFTGLYGQLLDELDAEKKHRAVQDVEIARLKSMMRQKPLFSLPPQY